MEKERLDRIVEKVAGILDKGFNNKLKEQVFDGGFDYQEYLNGLRGKDFKEIEDIISKRKAQIAEKEAIRSRQLGQFRFMAAHNTKAEMNHLRRLAKIEQEYLSKAKRAHNLKLMLGAGAGLMIPYMLFSGNND